MLERMWADGRLVEFMLLFVLIEVVVVTVIRQRSGRGPAFVPFVFNLLSGVFLMLALREALGAGSIEWILLWLLASLASHLVDLYVRWNWQGRKDGAGIGTTLGSNAGVES